MKLITLDTLTYFKQKLEALFIKKELKTGSATEYKVLSDNNLTNEMVTKINTIGSAYKIKGSKEFASLPTLAATEVGNVYNVTDAFTTTDNFVEGANKAYGAGSNVVCVEASEGVYKWDILGGFFDTSNLVKSGDIESVANADIDALFTSDAAA